MSDDNIFQAIVENIHERVDDDVAYGVFRDAQRQHGAQRAVTWLPTQFSTGPVDKLGRPCGPRPMYVERWDVECHIVGDEFADMEALRRKILYATREVLGTASQPTGGVWISQGMSEASVQTGGSQKVVQRFQWTVHMLTPEASEPSKVKITSIDTTEAVTRDDGTDATGDTFIMTAL